MMDKQRLYQLVKANFCDLSLYKERKDMFEISTPYATINNKFASVFVKKQEDKFIITDGGWCDAGYYVSEDIMPDDEVLSRVIYQFTKSYGIKTTTDLNGLVYYYKTCKDETDISSSVLDVANFVVGLVNAYCLAYKDDKEQEQRQLFSTDANGFFKANYEKDVEFKKKPFDDYQNISFDAVIHRKSQVFLIAYITGESNYSFTNSLRKSVVNFDISQKSRFSNFVKGRIPIINDSAGGFHTEKSKGVMDLLEEKTQRKPILWSSKDEVLESIG